MFEKRAVNSLLAFVIVSLQIWLPKKITRHALAGACLVILVLDGPSGLKSKIIPRKIELTCHTLEAL